jgi:transposase
VLLKVEAALLSGEVPPWAHEVLLEAVRHLLRCHSSEGLRASRSSERRHPRRRSTSRPAGHGRIGADAYTGAERVRVAHPKLRPGDCCPIAGCHGRLYDTKAPNENVELKGSAPVQATVYERQVLRCADCQETFAAPLPQAATGTKYAPSVGAVLAVARYGLGLPHHRLAQWQAWAGVPLPASTQFERVEALANAGSPALAEMEKLAADRAILHSDDTAGRILSLTAENKTRAADERSGVFTTGIVARGLDGSEPEIVLYTSGRRHAGENVDSLLERRSSEAGEAIHVADGTSMAPRRARIGSNCMVHARRNFIEIEAIFPEQCARVLGDIATVYRNDDATAGMSPDERLRYHQEHSAPVLEAMREWMDRELEERRVEPNSRLGKAFAYMKRKWEGLTRFLEVPGVPLDNNKIELQLKTAQRHRKNSLFYKNEPGAAIGDTLMSLIRTAIVNGVDPVRYLTALAAHAAEVRRAPQNWLPWNYRPPGQAATALN